MRETHTYNANNEQIYLIAVNRRQCVCLCVWRIRDANNIKKQMKNMGALSVLYMYEMGFLQKV